MQNNLILNKKLCEKIIHLEDYEKYKNVNEYIIYSDNILEGLTILNKMAMDDSIMHFVGCVYEPIDQPIYIFEDDLKQKFAIKICGVYTKWKLPKKVYNLQSFMDMPDYIVYSIKTKKVILAGENTETVSVGNSQWQREGRKIASAINGVPFIYQTFYSGRDESQDSIREPNSLQAYNQLVYSIRYKTASLVSYTINPFQNSQTRERTKDSSDLFVKYIKCLFICDAFPNSDNLDLLKSLEKYFYQHMLDYLSEHKPSDIKKINSDLTFTRLYKDLSILKYEFLEYLFGKNKKFANEIVNYLHTESEKVGKDYIENSKVLDFDKSKMFDWNKYYQTQPNIKTIINYLILNKKFPKSYKKGMSKVAFINAELANKFLKEKFPTKKKKIDEILDVKKYSDAVLMPLRLYKSNNKMIPSPDPESGEIVAYCELFSKSLHLKEKERPVIGYCFVPMPSNFSLGSIGSKLHKSLSNYVDILIINNNKMFTDILEVNDVEEYEPTSMMAIKPKTVTEEQAVVSAMLWNCVIKQRFKLNFVHTHHSSWQTFVIYDGVTEKLGKNDRRSTKVDLVMQKENKFLVIEGKNTIYDIAKDNKILKAMSDTSKVINSTFKKDNVKIYGFVCNALDKDFTIKDNKVVLSKKLLNIDLSNKTPTKNYFITFVCSKNNKTYFFVKYSNGFPEEYKKIIKEGIM